MPKSTIGKLASGNAKGIVNYFLKGQQASLHEYTASDLVAMTNYFLSEDEGHYSRWYGGTAEALGLVAGSQVSELEWKRVLQHLDPRDGTKLPNNGGRRADLSAVDFVISFEKDWSVLMVLADDEKRQIMEQIQHEVVDEVLAELERRVAVIRRGKDGSVHRSAAGFLAVVTWHDTSRPVDGKTAPSVHPHVTITNAALGSDGAVTALDLGRLYDAQAFVDALSAQLLATKSAERLGMVWERDGKGILREIGFPSDLRKATSLRQKQILDEARAQGVDPTDISALEKIQKSTKEGKVHCAHDPEAVEWVRPLAAEMGYTWDSMEATREATLLARGEAQADRAWIDANCSPRPEGRGALMDWRKQVATELAEHGPRTSAPVVAGPAWDRLKAALKIDTRTKQQIIADALRQVGLSNSTWTRADLENTLLSLSIPLDEAEALVSEYLGGDSAVKLYGFEDDPDSEVRVRSCDIATYASQETLQLEAWLIQAAKAGVDKMEPIATRKEFDEVLAVMAERGRAISPESDQFDAVAMMLLGGHQIIQIGGQAGVGKSTVMAPLEILEGLRRSKKQRPLGAALPRPDNEGPEILRVVGSATSAHAARALQEATAMTCYSSSELLDRLKDGRSVLCEGATVVWRDEPGKSDAEMEEMAAMVKAVNGRLVAPAEDPEVLHLVGVTLSENAARNLHDASGMTSYNSARLLMRLQDGSSVLADGCVLVWDEASQAATGQAALIAKMVTAADGHFIGAGDARQMQAVEAGGMYNTLIREVPEAVCFIDEIRRQQNLAERAVLASYHDIGLYGQLRPHTIAALQRQGVDKVIDLEALRDGGIEAVVDWYVSNDLIRLHDTAEETLAASAADYWDGIELRAAEDALPGSKPSTDPAVLLSASDNETVAVLNQAVIAEGVRRGHLDATDTVEFGGKTFIVGQRVLQRQNDKRIDAVNGNPGTVVGVDRAYEVTLSSPSRYQRTIVMYEAATVGSIVPLLFSPEQVKKERDASNQQVVISDANLKKARSAHKSAERALEFARRGVAPSDAATRKANAAQETKITRCAEKHDKAKSDLAAARRVLAGANAKGKTAAMAKVERAEEHLSECAVALREARSHNRFDQGRLRGKLTQMEQWETKAASELKQARDWQRFAKHLSDAGGPVAFEVDSISQPEHAPDLLVVRLDKGGLLRNTEEYVEAGNLEAGYAFTSDRSQGGTASRGGAHDAFDYVSLSRALQGTIANVTLAPLDAATMNEETANLAATNAWLAEHIGLESVGAAERRLVTELLASMPATSPLAGPQAQVVATEQLSESLALAMTHTPEDMYRAIADRAVAAHLNGVQHYAVAETHAMADALSDAIVRDLATHEGASRAHKVGDHLWTKGMPVVLSRDYVDGLKHGEQYTISTISKTDVFLVAADGTRTQITTEQLRNHFDSGLALTAARAAMLVPADASVSVVGSGLREEDHAWLTARTGPTNLFLTDPAVSHQVADAQAQYDFLVAKFTQDCAPGDMSAHAMLATQGFEMRKAAEERLEKAEGRLATAKAWASSAEARCDEVTLKLAERQLRTEEANVWAAWADSLPDEGGNVPAVVKSVEAVIEEETGQQKYRVVLDVPNPYGIVRTYATEVAPGQEVDIALSAKRVASERRNAATAVERQDRMLSSAAGRQTDAVDKLEVARDRLAEAEQILAEATVGLEHSGVEFKGLQSLQEEVRLSAKAVDEAKRFGPRDTARHDIELVVLDQRRRAKELTEKSERLGLEGPDRDLDEWVETMNDKEKALLAVASAEARLATICSRLPDNDPAIAAEIEKCAEHHALDKERLVTATTDLERYNDTLITMAAKYPKPYHPQVSTDPALSLSEAQRQQQVKLVALESYRLRWSIADPVKALGQTPDEGVQLEDYERVMAILHPPKSKGFLHQMTH